MIMVPVFYILLRHVTLKYLFCVWVDDEVVREKLSVTVHKDTLWMIVVF